MAGEWRTEASSGGTHPWQVNDALTSQTQVVNLRQKGMQLDDAPQIAERRQITGRSIADVLEVFKKTASLKYAANSRAKYINALLKIQR